MSRISIKLSYWLNPLLDSIPEDSWCFFIYFVPLYSFYVNYSSFWNVGRESCNSCLRWPCRIWSIDFYGLITLILLRRLSNFTGGGESLISTLKSSIIILCNCIALFYLAGRLSYFLILSTFIGVVFVGLSKVRFSLIVASFYANVG